MAHKWTDNGRDYIESAITTDGSADIIDTISIGNGTSSPNENDTSLDNQLYQNDTASPNVEIERGSGVGEIRATIEFTGGTEVPSNSEISEFGFSTNSGTLVYREVRSSPIEILSGQTKIVEIRATIEDETTDQQSAITTVGREFIADKLIGLTNTELEFIAVGDGTGNVDETSSTLSSELYRESKDASTVEIETTSNVGDINLEITVTAGTDASADVPPDAEISEFGVFTSDGTLLLHEKRDSIVILENTDTKTFDIPLTIVQ